MVCILIFQICIHLWNLFHEKDIVIIINARLQIT